VIETKDPQSIKRQEIEPYSFKQGERILFKTKNSFRCWNTDAFVEDFVYLSHEAAQHLVDCGVQTVGVDYLSVGGYKIDSLETHQVLLRAGVWIIEGLNLSEVKPGEYELICLPLKIAQGDGAPARAILKAKD
jgi:arylformamidase